MNASDTPTLGHPTRRSDVELRLPADSAYVSVLRTAAAGLAARLDFTIDDIEDLRMAVSEACSLVLPAADEGADLVSTFYLERGELTVEVTVDAASPEEPDRDSWAWQVLSALTTSADVYAADGHLTVSMTVNSGADL